MPLRYTRTTNPKLDSLQNRTDAVVIMLKFHNSARHHNITVLPRDAYRHALKKFTL
jgi:hypothetical protein